MGKLSNLWSQGTLSADLPYFDYECLLARETLVPWLSRYLDLTHARIGDFGCHQGGVLKVLGERFALQSGLGFDLNAQAVQSSPLHGPSAPPPLRVEVRDILTLQPSEHLFDLILFCDSLEHIPNYREALKTAAQCLAPGGHIFVSFPPYYSPFGGHQQEAANWMKLCPYVHYLPESLFFGLMRCEDTPYMSAAEAIEDLQVIRQTRLTLRRLESTARQAGLAVQVKDLFLLRPAFKVRYGIPTVRAGWLGKLPWLRECLVMGAYYLLSKR